MTRLRLCPAAAVTVTEAGVFFRSDLGTFQVAGADVGAFVDEVLPLLDGTRDRGEIVAALAAYARPSVTALLDGLEARGLVEAVPVIEGRLRGQEAFFRAWPASSSKDAQARLAVARVLVAGREPWGATAAAELEASGVGACQVVADPAEALDAVATAPPGGRWSLLLCAVPPGDAAAVEHVARLAHTAGIVSLWSHLDGGTAILGPLVTPGRTACRICAGVETLNPPLAGRSSAPHGREVMERLLGHLVALEAIRVISRYAPSPLGGRLHVEDLTTLESSMHTLVRLPWCRVCGRP